MMRCAQLCSRLAGFGDRTGQTWFAAKNCAYNLQATDLLRFEVNVWGGEALSSRITPVFLTKT